MSGNLFNDPRIIYISYSNADKRRKKQSFSHKSILSFRNNNKKRVNKLCLYLIVTISLCWLREIVVVSLRAALLFISRVKISNS